MAKDKQDKKEKKKQKKKEKAERKSYIKEIKAVLMGNVKRDDDGKLRAGKAHLVTRWGVGDGAKETFFLGVKKKKFVYNTKSINSKQALFSGEKALKDIGLRVYLENEPDAVVCYIKAIIFRPVVLILKEYNDPEEERQDKIAVYAYCGRSIMAFFSIRRAVQRFEKLMGKKIVRKSEQKAD